MTMQTKEKDLRVVTSNPSSARGSQIISDSKTELNCNSNTQGRARASVTDSITEANYPATKESIQVDENGSKFVDLN